MSILESILINRFNGRRIYLHVDLLNSGKEGE